MENNKFILINLNQTVSRFQLEEEKAEKNRWIVFGAITSLFLLLIIWFMTINSSINNLISDRKITIYELKNEIESLKKEGQVEGANHIPRGMLEFWLDPDSIYFKEGKLDLNKEMVLFCAGGLRSALAAKTLKDMGFEKVSHIDGGFGAIKQSKFKTT